MKKEYWPGKDLKLQEDNSVELRKISIYDDPVFMYPDSLNHNADIYYRKIRIEFPGLIYNYNVNKINLDNNNIQSNKDLTINKLNKLFSYPECQKLKTLN